MRCFAHAAASAQSALAVGWNSSGEWLPCNLRVSLREKGEKLPFPWTYLGFNDQVIGFVDHESSTHETLFAENFGEICSCLLVQQQVKTRVRLLGFIHTHLLSGCDTRLQRRHVRPTRSSSRKRSYVRAHPISTPLNTINGDGLIRTVNTFEAFTEPVDSK